MVKKKTNLFLAISSLVSVFAFSSYKLIAKSRDEHRSLSKSEIIEMTKVTDEEKENLAKSENHYEDIVSDAKRNNEAFFDDLYTDSKDRHFLFLADGGMLCGEMTDYNDILKIVDATFNSETDLNRVSFDEAKELRLLQDIRNKVDIALGNPIETE